MVARLADPLIEEIARYYSARLLNFGQTPQGVDWNGVESQTLRFSQLCRVLPSAGAFSVNDLGCGYGALHEFLAGRSPEFTYIGWDVAPVMVEAARQRLGKAPNARFAVGAAPAAPADYGIASGIFNVRQNRSDDQWRAYVEETLDSLDRTSLRGFAFNCLTAYSDVEKMKPYLYYADPCQIFDFCKRRFSPHVALLHDYGLYEFTILVRKFA